jgi:hypothetical protein
MTYKEAQPIVRLIERIDEITSLLDQVDSLEGPPKVIAEIKGVVEKAHQEVLFELSRYNLSL